MLEFPDNLFCAVGQIAIYWSMVENSMHNCIFIIYHKCGGKSIASCGKMRKELSHRIRCWEKFFNELPILHLFKIDGLSLLKRINSLKNDGHNMIHGVFSGIYGNTFKFVIPFDIKSMEKNEYIVLERKVNYLFEIVKKMQSLAKDLQEFSYQLQGQFGNR